ncbi:hypothetical protein K1719_035213 [Acacia pycnantha]|nr:hypothetical protein K1719_035213 [Acacia pycnantha]
METLKNRCFSLPGQAALNVGLIPGSISPSSWCTSLSPFSASFQVAGPTQPRRRTLARSSLSINFGLALGSRRGTDSPLGLTRLPYLGIIV